MTGPSNYFAFAAAQPSLARRRPPITLFIYGGVGLGKTHLLHAIGQVAGAGKHVIYVTAETFTNEMVAAIRGKTMDEFRSRYRTVDVLLIDDAQFVAGKTSTEEEFYHTFNAVFSRGGKIALASDVHPRSISGLDERLRSRFEGGLLADIQAPEYETRHRIVKAKSAAQDVTLPDDIAELMARHETDNVRELEGLLTQVLARTKLTKEPLTLALAQAVLNKNSARPPQPTRRATSIDQVLQATAKYHQLSMDDLLSKRRTKAVVAPAEIAMYLAREETAASFPRSGRRWAGAITYGAARLPEDRRGSGPGRGSAPRGERHPPPAQPVRELAPDFSTRLCRAAAPPGRFCCPPRFATGLSITCPIYRQVRTAGFFNIRYPPVYTAPAVPDSPPYIGAGTGRAQASTPA